MKTYTKQERLDIYKKALDLFHDPGFWRVNYLCCALNIVTNWRYDVVDFPDFLESVFPEIYALKPKGLEGGRVWWPGQGREIRIKKLTEVINKMKLNTTP